MTIRFIEFDALQSRQHGLIDASSIAELEDKATTLTSELNPHLADLILNNQDEFSLRESLSILERWIVIDNLIVDLVSLDTLQNGKAAHSFEIPEEQSLLRKIDASNVRTFRQNAFVSHVKSALLEETHDPSLSKAHELMLELEISATFIPFDVVHECAELIRRTSQAIQEARPNVAWRNFAFGQEKRYGEVLGEFYGAAAFLARSHLGVERTLFYYEVAGAGGVPLLLHPSRNYEVREINQACRDAYQAVKLVLLRNFEEPIRAELENLGLTDEVDLPALTVRMVRLASENRTSILNAAKAIKDSPEAKSFRKWLAEIQENLNDAHWKGDLSALTALRELGNVATSWKNELDTRHGVTYKKRKFQLSWVPRIGALLALLESPTIRDPILNRKGYLTFVSSWYQD